MIILIATVVLSLLSYCSAEEEVITPFGRRPAECVLTVPSGATVSLGTDANSLKISHPVIGDYLHEVPPNCGDDIAQIKERVASRVNTGYDGWLDNAGWYPPQGENNLATFSATYIVPGNPPSVGKQVLFYFIGMQDNDAPNAINILQPVLTWGNGHQEWYVQSWACCPKNITVNSPPVFGLQPGSQVGGTIFRVSDSTWRVDSLFNGQHSTLNAQVGDYIYNWADVTLEVYSVNACGDFAPGKAYFNDLKLTDKQGQALTPQWSFSKPTQCSGQITQSGAAQIFIQHTNTN